jgi:hypothetical protein
MYLNNRIRIILIRIQRVILNYNKRKIFYTKMNKKKEFIIAL